MADTTENDAPWLCDSCGDVTDVHPTAACRREVWVREVACDVPSV